MASPDDVEDDNKKLDANAGADGDEDEDSKIFPQRLMEILSEESNMDAICWLPHGRAFIIRNRKLFAEKVMPRYFSRKAKYSSFTRKLNRWSFTRVSSGPELGAYYHEFFLRDKPYLAAQMFCKNARTMLAMANDTPKPSLSNAAAAAATVVSKEVPPVAVAEKEPVVAQQSVPAVPLQSVTSLSNSIGLNSMGLGPVAAPASLPTSQLSPLLLQALTKQPTGPETGKIHNALGVPYPATTLQLLKRQVEIMEQEQANRLLLQHAIGISLQDQNHAATLAAQQARLLQMTQMLELRQQTKRPPTNPRASAA